MCELVTSILKTLHFKNDPHFWGFASWEFDVKCHWNVAERQWNYWYLIVRIPSTGIVLVCFGFVVVLVIVCQYKTILFFIWNDRILLDKSFSVLHRWVPLDPELVQFHDLCHYAAVTWQYSLQKHRQFWNLRKEKPGRVIVKRCQCFFVIVSVFKDTQDQLRIKQKDHTLKQRKPKQNKNTKDCTRGELIEKTLCRYSEKLYECYGV